MEDRRIADIDVIDALQTEELTDFLTNFQFPWEEAASSGKQEGDSRRRSSQRHTLSDTTPARRTRPLSGKVLSEDFLEMGNLAYGGLNGVNEENPSDTQSSDCSERPSDGAVASDEGLRVDREAEVPPVQDIQKGGIELPVKKPVTTNTGSSACGKSKRRKRRQSSVFKKRESLALLKTIGEILSPNSPKCNNIVLTPPSELVTGMQIQRGDASLDTKRDVKPIVKEKRTRSSRRSSRRLSGIGGPMLELGANGIPKLLQLEQVYAPYVGLGEGQSDSPKDHKVDAAQNETSGNKDPDLSSPMEIEAVRGTALTATPDLKANLDYRVNAQSPLTPLIVSTPASPGDGEYSTPRGPTVYREPAQSLSTPETAMIGSLQHLELHTKLTNSCEEGSVNQESEMSNPRLVNGEVEEAGMDPRIPEIPTLTPDTTPEEFASPMTNLPDEESRAMELEDGENTFNKENLLHSDSPDEDEFLDLCDEKVKNLYLKKGQVGPKKGNTNLETVFEDSLRRDAGLSRRKFKRLLAFPEKPWETRKGTKGRKLKRKRYSLSRTAKRNDPILQERLNLVLNNIAEDCC